MLVRLKPDFQATARNACYVPVGGAVSGTGNRPVSLTYFTMSAYNFCRAMHCGAKHGLAIACRPSVRLSVCLSVCPRPSVCD